MQASDRTRDERILILAPRGRDAEVVHDVLTREGFACGAVSGFDLLVRELTAGAGLCVIAEEALLDASVKALLRWLSKQEPWSDFPIVLLISHRAQLDDRQDATSRELLSELGNVIQLERPLNVDTLCSAATSALRARRRQYQARDVLAEKLLTAETLQESRAELVALNETLESRINERTRALASANDRLMNEINERERVQQAMNQFQKMEAVGRLTGGIAHDFNNLLNVIQGSMDLILFRSHDAFARTKAEVARVACERGGKLTSQLLAFSRNQHLDLRPTEVRTIFDGVRELMTTSLGREIELVFDIEDASLVAVVDTNQMEMALLNLAINARDAMPDGGRLVVGARRASPPEQLLPAGSYCLITVSDSGTGIRADLIAKVFEPFFTTKDIGKGTGLGLSQVYGMAQQFGGTANIVSTVGAGTTIELWLPLADDAHVDAPSLSQQRPAMARRGARILVVEDDSSVRQSMAESLEALGYVVAQACDGQAGLQALRALPPDLMITDFLMPGMTGAELVRLATEEFPTLPMIIATGYADMDAIDEVIGTNVVLRKPFQLNELAATVQRSLQTVPS